MKLLDYLKDNPDFSLYIYNNTWIKLGSYERDAKKITYHCNNLDVLDFYDDFAIIKIYSILQTTGKYAYVDKSGNLIGEPPKWFTTAYDFKNGLAKVQMNTPLQKYNFINTKGEYLSNVSFYECGEFYLDYTWVKIGEKYFYKHKTGKWLVKNGIVVETPFNPEVYKFADKYFFSVNGVYMSEFGMYFHFTPSALEQLVENGNFYIYSKFFGTNRRN